MRNLLRDLDVVLFVRRADAETWRLLGFIVAISMMGIVSMYIATTHTDQLAHLWGGRTVCQRTDNAFFFPLICIGFGFFLCLVTAVGEAVQNANWRRYRSGKGSPSRSMSSSSRPAILWGCASALLALAGIVLIVRC